MGTRMSDSEHYLLTGGAVGAFVGLGDGVAQRRRFSKKEKAPPKRGSLPGDFVLTSAVSVGRAYRSDRLADHPGQGSASADRASGSAVRPAAVPASDLVRPGSVGRTSDLGSDCSYERTLVSPPDPISTCRRQSRSKWFFLHTSRVMTAR